MNISFGLGTIRDGMEFIDRSDLIAFYHTIIFDECVTLVISKRVPKILEIDEKEELFCF